MILLVKFFHGIESVKLRFIYMILLFFFRLYPKKNQEIVKRKSKKDILVTGTLSHEPYQLNRPRLTQFSTDLFLSNGIEFTNSYPESILACRQTKVDVFPIETVS